MLAKIYCGKIFPYSLIFVLFFISRQKIKREIKKQNIKLYHLNVSSPFSTASPIPSESNIQQAMFKRNWGNKIKDGDIRTTMKHRSRCVCNKEKCVKLLHLFSLLIKYKILYSSSISQISNFSLRLFLLFFSNS